MPDDRVEKCGKCKWAKHIKDEYYSCHRYPPRYIQSTTGQFNEIVPITVWVSSDDFCGDYKHA